MLSLIEDIWSQTTAKCNGTCFGINHQKTVQNKFLWWVGYEKHCIPVLYILYIDTIIRKASFLRFH